MIAQMAWQVLTDTLFCGTGTSIHPPLHAKAANQDFQHVSLKLHTSKYGKGDFHFTETFKGFPIGNYHH